MGRREVRFSVSDSEWEAIAAYVESKRRWRRVSDLARYCVFVEMDRNKSGGHRKGMGAPQHHASGANSEGDL